MSASRALQAWHELLSAYPVQVSQADYKDGIGYWLSLQWLKGSAQIQMPVLRAEIGKEAISRLQWHRLVRELIMKRVQPAKAA